MVSDAIIEALKSAIENKIIGEWRHEGGVLGISAEHINVEIDGKEYVITLKEVEEGKNFSEYLHENKCNHDWEYLASPEFYNLLAQKRRCRLCGIEEVKYG